MGICCVSFWVSCWRQATILPASMLAFSPKDLMLGVTLGVLSGVMLGVIFSSTYRASMLAVSAEEDMLDVISVVRLGVMLGSSCPAIVFSVSTEAILFGLIWGVMLCIKLYVTFGSGYQRACLQSRRSMLS